MDNFVNPFSGLFAKIGGNVAEKVLTAADGLFTSKEEREAKANELRQIISNEVIAGLNADVLEMQNAREREIKISEATGSTWLQKSIVPIIALAVLILSFSLFFVFNFTSYIEQSKRDIAAQMIGSINALCIMVVGYYFGSSHKKQ